MREAVDIERSVAMALVLMCCAAHCTCLYCQGNLVPLTLHVPVFYDSWKIKARWMGLSQWRLSELGRLQTPVVSRPIGINVRKPFYVVLAHRACVSVDVLHTI